MIYLRLWLYAAALVLFAGRIARFARLTGRLLQSMGRPAACRPILEAAPQGAVSLPPLAVRSTADLTTIWETVLYSARPNIARALPHRR